MAEQGSVAIVCEHCGMVMESCAFCERNDCGHVICYLCLRTALRETMAHPHVHGG